MHSFKENISEVKTFFFGHLITYGILFFFWITTKSLHLLSNFHLLLTWDQRHLLPFYSTGPVYFLGWKYTDPLKLQVFNMRQRERKFEVTSFYKEPLMRVSIYLKSHIRGRKSSLDQMCLHDSRGMQTGTQRLVGDCKEFYCWCTGASTQKSLKRAVGWSWGLMLISRWMVEWDHGCDFKA